MTLIVTDQTVHSRGRIGKAVRLRQEQEPPLSRFSVDGCAIFLVRKGEAVLRNEAFHLTLSEGDALAVAANQSLDLALASEDRAGAVDCIFPARTLLNQVAQDHEGVPVIASAVPLRSPHAEFLSAFEAALCAIQHPERCPMLLAAHRVTEVLLWLVHHGYRFQPTAIRTLSSRIRSIVRSSPAEPWSLARMAARLSVRESTLRRRLTEQGSPFSELLIDERMSVAARLLQTTDAPVAHIALTVGYDSPSRFAARFKQHFGHCPHASRREHRPAQKPD